jgi:hypothetical protein
MRQVLSDLRVVETDSGVAASWCGKAFADLGPDVVKIEPPHGDRLRRDPGLFAHLNTKKRSVVLEVAPAATPALWAGWRVWTSGLAEPAVPGTEKRRRLVSFTQSCGGR